MTEDKQDLDSFAVIAEGFKAAARGERDIPDWMISQGRIEQAERDIRLYMGLLDEWEQEFKKRYGDASEEYQGLITENEKTREQLNEDLERIGDPKTQMKAIEIYRSIWTKYRKFEQVEGSHEFKQRQTRREPGIV